MAPIPSDWTPPPEAVHECPILTDPEHAKAAWPWLKAQCAPSTWDAFVRSVAVRYPEVRTWPVA